MPYAKTTRCHDDPSERKSGAVSEYTAVSPIYAHSALIMLIHGHSPSPNHCMVSVPGGAIMIPKPTPWMTRHNNSAPNVLQYELRICPIASSQIPTRNARSAPSRSETTAPSSEKIEIHSAITEMMSPALPSEMCSDLMIGFRIGAGASQVIVWPTKARNIRISMTHRYGESLLCSINPRLLDATVSYNRRAPKMPPAGADPGTQWSIPGSVVAGEGSGNSSNQIFCSPLAHRR